MAFQMLFDQWWDKVYSTAMIFSKSEELSRDTAQEVFLHFWKERSKMTSVENPQAYLAVMARNMIFRKLSRLKLETAYQTYVSGVLSSSQNNTPTDQPAKFKELQQAIEEGVRLLPPQQQRAFRLSREQGLSHEEIALEMNVSRQSVKDYIVRAIAFLRKHLQRYGHLILILIFTIICVVRLSFF
jgi:RNA polymerase sigma-70 factor (family 1)